MTPHASAAQLAAWLPSGVTVGDTNETLRQLTRASEDIDYVVLAGYAVDTNGLATNARIKQALADAVCAQVEFYIEVGEEGGIDGRARTQTSVSGSSGTRAPSVGPRALHILSVNGLR